MASDLSTVAFIFVKKYATSAEDVAQRLHPLFARIPKEDGFVGSSFSYFIRHTNPQGISGVLANAITNSATSKGKQLQCSRYSKYGVITLDAEAITACADKGAMLDLVSMETDGVLDAASQRLAEIRKAYVLDSGAYVSSHNDFLPRNLLFDGSGMPVTGL